MAGHGPDDDRRSRVSDLFAQLRDETAKPAPSKPAPSKPAAADPPPPGPEPDRVREPVATPIAARPPVAATAADGADEAVRGARDAMLEVVLPTLVSAAKRRLQDEQNDVMDTLRRQRTKLDPDAVVASADAQREVWADLMRRAVDEAYGAGLVLVGAGAARAPRRYLVELAASVEAPLRERVLATIQSVARDSSQYRGPELLATLTSAVSARYREWRAQDLEALLGDVLAHAFALGAYDAVPVGTPMRWVPAAVEECPDADDNALEPTVKGAAFPTGQACAPAHPGCRCVVVPVALAV